MTTAPEDSMSVEAAMLRHFLETESTSSSERDFALYLRDTLPVDDTSVSLDESEGGVVNLQLSWGDAPRFYFCTHMDTVPPYIPPKVFSIGKGDVLPDGTVFEGEEDTLITGRGSCDAKGQILAMYLACRRLLSLGEKDFALLLVSGEETGSFGAKAFTAKGGRGDAVIVGEPTCNRILEAAKGTKRFNVTLYGKSCHSGYPGHGESSIDKFVCLYRSLQEYQFPIDPLLGPTTWNIGHLRSDNAQNVLSPETSFTIYFRTTFESDAMVESVLRGLCPDGTRIEAFGGDTPMRFFTGEGIQTDIAAFGSDAPQLGGFPIRAIYGPGSILTAHTANEYVLLSDIRRGVDDLVDIYFQIKERLEQQR